MCAAPIKPWEPANIPEEIQAELNRRRVNRSFNFVDGEKGGWNDINGEWTKYRGPMIPWVRLTSYGEGRQTGTDAGNPGFVLFGGKDFYSGYGFMGKDKDNFQSIIGYRLDGWPHKIDNDLNQKYPIHVPPPEIEKVNCIIQKELYRKVTVDWVCFSKRQLEYMTPYFLVPGITCVMEYGWNHFNPDSLLPISNIAKMKEFNNNPYPLYTDYILKSNGNYDVTFGRIVHFEWSIDGNKIRCKTEFYSEQRLYAGLIIDSTTVDVSDKKKEEVKPFDNLPEFVDQNLTKLKELGTKKPTEIKGLESFVGYLQHHHPTNWKAYIYGVFYGRDLEDLAKSSNYDNKKDDFDRKKPYENLWISMGLLMEVINFHSEMLKLLNKKEVFRVDIDDCVISAHPNLISTDGSILLIPNSEAPHYHEGFYGQKASKDDYTNIKNCTENISRTRSLADKREVTICQHTNFQSKRDDLDELINALRYKKVGVANYPYEFPFSSDEIMEKGQEKPYPARYSGLLRNLYFNVDKLKQLVVKNSQVKTYVELIEKILEEINKAAGNFWTFHLVNAWGKDGMPKDSPATLKIVDDKFTATANKGKTYMFDYMDADSLLLGLNFKPTLSNAKGIQVVFAGRQNPSQTRLINGANELLDYVFRDLLLNDEDAKVQNTFPTTGTANDTPPSTDKFDEIMRSLQMVRPKDNTVFQMTDKSNGKILIRRLVLPEESILTTLLDDGDEEKNPNYMGIMPGVQHTFTIQGIAGLRTFMCFLVRNLPEPYSHKNIVFRIVDVQESIENGKWTTTIVAGLIPLRGWIKARLGVEN